jgi:hypothetical protein
MMKAARTTIFALAACLSTSVFAAPSLASYAFLGTSHDLQWPNTTSFVGQYDPLGGPVIASGSAEFVGPDRNGDERTTTFGGTATANASYGMLKTSLTASLTNTFYNPANAGNDIPHIYVGAGQATFSDTLRFVGTFMLPTFKVRYTYFVHGTLTGSAYASLGVNIGSDPRDGLFLQSGDGPQIAQYWSTALHELNPMLTHDLQTNFLSGFQQDTKFLADGSNRSGTAEFSSTITLSNIEVFDQNNNPFYDFTIESGSGTIYPAANAVPEPATCAALTLGVLACLRKRRGKGMRGKGIRELGN